MSSSGTTGSAVCPSLDAVLTGLGAAPAECLFVGHSELDQQVAQAAGIPFYLLSYGYAAQDWEFIAEATTDCFTALTETIVARYAFALSGGHSCAVRQAPAQKLCAQE